MALSLGDWISVLDEQAPEEIVRVSKTVHPARFESACVVDALERQGRFPAVLFESVTDLKGRPTSFKIIKLQTLDFTWPQPGKGQVLQA